MGAGASVSNNNKSSNKINPHTNDPVEGTHVVSVSGSDNNSIRVINCINSINNLTINSFVIQEAYNIGYKAGTGILESKLMRKFFNAYSEHYDKGFSDAKLFTNLSTESELDNNESNKITKDPVYYQKQYGEKYMQSLDKMVENTVA